MFNDIQSDNRNDDASGRKISNQWMNNYKIPWSKFPKSLLAKCTLQSMWRKVWSVMKVTYVVGGKCGHSPYI
jgi:hypothetical protein